MTSLFSIPMDTILCWMVGMFLIATLVVGILAALNPLFFKMGLRNIPRRRAQTILIVVGLMLSTVIITSAFGTGDTLSYSVRSVVTTGLGSVDETVFRISSFDGQPLVNDAGPIAPATVRIIEANVAANPAAAASMPALLAATPLQDLTSGQTKAGSLLEAFPPAYTAKFGALTTTGGSTVTLGQLRPNEAYLNAKAADDLNARAGDTLLTYLAGTSVRLYVRAILQDENLASGGLSTAGTQLLPAILVPLGRVSQLQPNVLLVANKGDAANSPGNSDAVTSGLRALLANPVSAHVAHSLLAGATGQAQLAKLIADPAQAGVKSNLQDLQAEVQRTGDSNRLESLLSDPAVVSALNTIKTPGFSQQLNDTLAAMSDYSVQQVMQDGLAGADLLASVIVAIFIVFGLFSIAAGIMLIFLIFVMLAAERRAEMGMARAVGTKRRHLIQQFLFEGYVYNVGAALVGIVLGILVSLGMARIMASLFGASDFAIIGHIEPRSLVVSFCLGALVTLLTVVFASVRASRLNVVAAIRDLPEGFGANRTLAVAWRLSLQRLPRHPRRHLIRTFFTIAGLLMSLIMIKGAHGLMGFGIVLVMLGFCFWPLVAALLARGIVLAVAGAALTVVGLNTTQAAWWGIGNSLVLIGVAMSIRWILSFTRMRASLANRIAYSLAGVLLVIYWLLPFGFWHRFGVPKLSGGIEMFFVSGILLVTGGVWSVMYNADLIATALVRLFSRAGSLAPTMKMAVTYPMQNKFRTGLTLAMFSLVIFTLMVMSVLIRSSATSLDVARDTGGYQIYGNVSQPAAEAGNAAVLAANPKLRTAIVAMGGMGKEPVGIRQTGQADTSWHPYIANVLDNAYLSTTRFTLHARAVGYSTDAQVWQTLRTKPGYAVIDGLLAEPPSNGTASTFGGGFTIKGIKYDDRTFVPRQIALLDPRSMTIVPLTVIGVLDQDASYYLPDLAAGVYTGANSFTARGVPPPSPTTFVYRVAAGANVHATALLLGKTFFAEGLDVKEAQKQFDTNQSLNVGLNYLLEGFMALGLVVGIAALGVVAFRSVVERRQQIGMMRAIGFQSGMVRTTFLLESSFVAILGTVLGVVLGLALAYNLVASIATPNNGITFTVPWLQIAIIVVVAYVASLITTYLPAWQASRVYPAEALRYE